MIHTDYPLSTGEVLRIAAKDVRRERTGIHALVSISLNGTVLEYDDIAPLKREERGRLANAAYKRLGAVTQKSWPSGHMTDALGLFCLTLWDRHLEARRAIMLSAPELTPLRYVLEPYIVQGGGTILFGPRGAGKTYLGLIMARAIDAGVLWHCQPDARVLFIQLERSEETFGRRLHLVNRALGLDPGAPMSTIIARGETLSDIRDVVARQVEEDGVGLVVLDSISRTGAGALTEDRTANTVMDTLNKVAPSWLAIAHTSHQGAADGREMHTFGSSMFENAADVIVALTSERRGSTLGVALQLTKANDVPPQQPEFLALEFDADGLSAIRRSAQGEFAELDTTVRRSKVDEIIEYLQHVDAATAGEVADACGLSRGRAAHILAESATFVRLRKVGRDVFYGLCARRADEPRGWAE